MTSAGRPRDPRIDDALRNVVHELLVDDGYVGLTVQGAARAAGVSAAAIYRRFPGKRELVEWALFPSYEWVEPRYSGDLGKDLTVLTQIVLAWLSQPAMRAALPGLLGEYVRDSNRYDELLRDAVVPVRKSLESLVTSDVDVGALLDVLLGACLLEAMVSDGKHQRTASERIAEIVRRATA